MKLTPYSNPFHNQAKRVLAGALSVVDSIDGAVDGGCGIAGKESDHIRNVKGCIMPRGEAVRMIRS